MLPLWIFTWLTNSHHSDPKMHSFGETLSYHSIKIYPYQLLYPLIFCFHTTSCSHHFFVCLRIYWHFPGGPVVKNPPAKEADVDSISGLERSHMSQRN